MELLLLASATPFLLLSLAGTELGLTRTGPSAAALAGILLWSMVIVEALIVVASISLGASSPSFRRASAAFATVALFGALLNLSSSAVLLRQGLSAPALDSLAGVGRFATAGLLLWALWVTRRQVQVQLRSSLGVAAGLAAVAILGSLLLSPLGRAGTAWIARPWQLLPLSLLLAATVPLAGTLSDRSRGELASRLSLCLLPQIAAQLHLALASRSAFDHDFTAFLLLQLLAETTVLWILARNGLARFHRGALAVRRLEESLNRSTQDLAESRQLLVAESEGRNAAERTLRFLQAAVETTKIGVVVTDLEGRILYSNPGQARMVGLEPKDLLGQPARLLAPASLRQSSTRYRLDDTGGFQRESLNLHRDGSEIPVLLTSDLVRDEDGTPVARVTIAENISHRKQTERELLQRGATLGAISTAAARLLQGRDWESGIQDSLAMLGAALSVRRAFAFESVTGEGNRPALSLRFGWGIAHGKSDEHDSLDEIAFAAEREVQLLEDLRHGEPLWGTLEELGDCLPTSFRQIAGKSLLLQPVFVWDRWWGVIGVSDHYEREWSVAEVEGLSTAAELLGAAITRQASEQALRESEQRYRSFFESATDLILSLAADGRFSYVNQAWRDTLGVSAAEVEDLKIFDFVAPEQRRVFENLFQRILAGEAVGQIETIFVSKHGSHVLVEGTFSTERSAGQTLSIRAIFRDITQRRRIERMKGEFVAIVSHELRTPLTSIHAGLRLLRQKHASRLSDSGQQLLELAHQNSYRLSALIDDIIDVERLDSGRLTFFLEDHVLTRLMAAAVDETQAFANRFGIAMAQRPATADYRVRVDGGRFVQVLKNLLTNAIKFSPKNGFVEVLATPRHDRVRVEVRDQGPGIPPEFGEKIFERFFQVDPSETRSKEGTGLGLNIAKSIIERLDGEIGFECPPGGGTIFFFDLPLLDPLTVGEGSSEASPARYD